MLALLVLFLFVLATMFVGFMKKPAITLTTAITGLVVTAVTLISQWDNPSTFLSSYEGVYFDNTAILFSLAAILFTTMVIIGGYKSMDDNKEQTADKVSLLMFSLIGAMIMTSFTDLFLFFLGLEILSIPIYVMAASNKKDVFSVESGLKYFITGAFATGVLLFGIAWVYGATGSFKVAEINEYFATTESVSSLVYIGILMIMSSFLFKLSAAPFHFWSPDVYDGAPAPVTGFMATVIKLGAFAAFLKLFAVAFYGAADFWVPALTFLAMLTMFVGNLSAIRQVRLKRLLAYSSIAHVGYSLVTMIVLTENSAYNLWYYLFSYGFATIAIITVQLIVNDREDRIEAFKGLGRANPFVGFVAVVALLALAGVPPLMGFFGKFLVFADAISANPGLIAVALLNSGIGIYYYLRIAILIMQKPSEDSEIEVSEFKASKAQLFVLTLAIIGLLFGGALLSFN